MHEPRPIVIKTGHKPNRKASRGIDLKAAYTILIRAYLRNHPDIFKVKKQTTGEHHA